MKIVLPGGTGHLGRIVAAALSAEGHEVVVLGRRQAPPQAEWPDGVRQVGWDGATLGDWAGEVDGADAVLNLAGRTVSCRYTDEHLREMMDSRVTSTRAVGEAIAAASAPPRVWLQASTATIYAHTFGAPHDEATGVLGGEEPDVPLYWEYSVRIARRWEAALAEADLPHTRRVALRTAIVMDADRGGAFDYMLWMARLGIGGSVAGGRQYVSWLHETDLVRAVRFLLDDDGPGGALTGPVNLAAPAPLPQAEFMRQLRRAWSGWAGRVGLPATRAMAELGALALRTDTELLLKSRRVVPGRLLESGFTFEHPTWAGAAADLVRRVRAR